MKIALIQFNASANKENNVRRAKEFVREAALKGASWILLPEVFSLRGNLLDKTVLSQAQEAIPGPTTQIFQEIAQKSKAHILLGSLLEKTSENKPYNTSVAIQAGSGSIVKYRKIHLFDAIVDDKIIRESDFFAAGNQVQMMSVQEFRVGLSICYDLRFPNLYQNQARQGMDVLTVPSCFTKMTGLVHWEILLRARAIENLCYVVAPNQIGKDARGVEAHGHSMVIGPWGEIIVQGSANQEEIIYAEISIEQIKQARKKLPGIIKE